jgi:peptide/nickel transport system substrate-binding protein
MMRSLARRATTVVAALAIGGLVMAACGSSSSGPTTTTQPSGNVGQFGTLPGPGSGTHQSGGVVSVAESPGAGPSYIFPITPAADSSVYTAYQFQNLMWRPLWWGPKGDTPAIDYSQSIATAPTFSNDNKTVTIDLNANWKWSDGQPVTSQDVEFMIDILKAAVKESPANYGNYTPGLFPDFVTAISTPSPTQIVLTINKTYNQNWLFLDQLALLIPLPAHAWARTSANGPIVDFTNPANAKKIYDFLNKQSATLGTYATNPLWQVVDGPFKLKGFDVSTYANTMVPNAAYSGPVKPSISELDNVAFTSTEAEFNQLLSQNLTVGFVDFSDLPQVSKLKSLGYTVWGFPDFGFSYVDYNFKDTTGDFNKIIAQLYIRQAIADLQDQPALIQSKGVFDGAAGQAYGPVPAIPTSPFAPPNALTNPYPFSISNASKLLSDHGWDVVANGTTTCKSPGTGANECGAGIPAGTPLTWNLVYGNSPAVIGSQDEVLASNAKQIGITINLESKTFNYIIQNLSDVGNPDNDHLWAMQDFGGFTNSYYPTTNQLFNTTGSFNQGGYSDPTADADINNSVTSLNNNAIETEISYITAQQPGLFQPNADLVFAIKDTLHGPSSSFADLSQYQDSPEYWYFTS